MTIASSLRGTTLGWASTSVGIMGTSWTNTLIPGYPGGSTATLSGYTTGSDPSLAFDQTGNLYYAGIVFVRTSSGGAIDGSAFVARSTDNGTSWAETIVALGSNTRRSSVFNDKPYLAVDTITNSTFKGRVYISWTQFVNNGGGTILFSESNNGGLTFSLPIILSNSPDNQASSRTWDPTEPCTLHGMT